MLNGSVRLLYLRRQNCILQENDCSATFSLTICLKGDRVNCFYWSWEATNWMCSIRIMSYFKHTVSYKHQDSTFGNSGGFQVVWWLFNWIAINSSKKKKKKRNLSLSAQSQVKYCNDFLLYIFLVPDTSQKNFFGGPIWKFTKETLATKYIPGHSL